MSTVTRALVILTLISLHGGLAETLYDSRILKTRRVTRIINRQLVGIEHRNYDCNDTVYEVMDKMENVSRRIDNLHRGPYIGNMDLSAGYTEANKVLLMLPDPVVECIHSYEGTNVPKREVLFTCIRQILWRFEIPESERMIKREERLLSKYSRKSHLDRYNRARKPSTEYTVDASPNRKPLMMSTQTATPGFQSSASSTATTPVPLRVRKEYRTLTLTERTRFHNALKVLHSRGVIRRFARMHRRARRGAHGGPAFLPWHRAFITLFEDALQDVDPSVTLPYWDSTKDDQMANPIAAIQWSEDYLGNGVGQVVTGPFANWETDSGFLERTYSIRGRLVSRLNTLRVMTRCFYRQVTVPTGPRRFRIESFHNSVHVWVGGDMSSVGTAPFDPVFYLHHCFIDYLWEQFRERQRVICGVDPETDYIDAGGRHNINSNMAQMRDYQVIDGLSNYWTDSVFRYEEPPTCDNNCGGSDALYCDGLLQDCVPISRFGTGTQTTTTPFWFIPTSPSVRKRRQANGEAYQEERQEGYKAPSKKEQKASTETCDAYLDPGCLLADVKWSAENKEPISPIQEQQIFRNMVPRPRGESFETDTETGEGDARTLYSYEDDLKAYPKRKQTFLKNLKAALKRDLV